MTGKILPDDPRPPKKGDKLFAVGSPGYHNASLDIGAGDWDAYAMAYRLAAGLLAGHVADNIVYSNLLGFPVLFLYRQYLELRIKDLGVAAAQLLGQEYAVPIEHKLLRLWQGVRPMLEEVFPGSTQEFNPVEEKIREFCAVDPGSCTFRYPVDTTGKPTLPTAPKYVQINADGWPVNPPPEPGLKHVDISHLKEIMDGVAAVLDGCSIRLYEAQTAKWDEWAEMGGGCDS